MNCFFVHSKDPKHLDTATTQLCELFSADTEQTFGCILIMTFFQRWVFGEKGTTNYKGCYRKLGCLGGTNLTEGRDVGNTTSNLFVFRMLLFLSKIYSCIIGTCWRSLGWVEEEDIKTHRAFAIPWLFSQRRTMRTLFELYRYLCPSQALDFKHIRWELDRHDMDLHVFL